MERVAIYSRKSVFTGKGESIENQIEMCKDYYNRTHNNNEVEFLIYEDEGFSGGNINRPRFKELISDAKNKKFKALVCYRLDRISRNVADFSSTLELLQDNDIDFISIKEQFDTSTPMGRAMIYIASVFAQLERETIAERVRDNMLQLARTGRWLGGQEPFGFTSEKSIYLDENFNERSLMILSPISDELQVIKLIYDKYLEVNSITQVVNWLQDNRYKGKNGGEWTTTQVQRILNSPLYVKSTEEVNSYLRSLGVNVFGEANGNGYLSYNKTRKMIFDRDITEWIYAISKHKGIIPSDKWLKVQSILEKNKNKKIKRLGTGTNNTALLTGILKCAKCGSNMIVKQGHKSKKESGKRYDYYVCSSKDNSKGKKCDNKNIRTDRLDNIIIGQLSAYNKEHLSSDLYNLLMTSKNNKISNNKLETLKNDISIKENQISTLVKQLSSAPNESVSNYIMQEIRTLGDEVKDLKFKLDNTSENKKTYEQDIRNLELIIEMLEHFHRNFDITDDISQKRLMLQTILQKVTWNGETLEANLSILESKKK